MSTRKLAGIIAIVSWVALTASGSVAAENLKKLTGSQIRIAMPGMQITDKVHWRYVYEHDGTLRSYSMGRKRVGKWMVEKNELCLDLKNSDDGCFEVWRSGMNVELRPSGLGMPLEGVIEKSTDRN